MKKPKRTNEEIEMLRKEIIIKQEYRVPHYDNKYKPYAGLPVKQEIIENHLDNFSAILYSELQIN